MPELDDKEYENRILRMKGSDYWAEHAGQVRLVKCQRESELQGIEAEPWYFLYWSDEQQGLKPSHPYEWCGQCRAVPFGTSWTMS